MDRTMQLCQGEARRPVIYLACDRWNVSRFGDRTMIREDCVAGARDGGREVRGEVAYKYVGSKRWRNHSQNVRR